MAVSPRTALLRIIATDEPDSLKEELERRNTSLTEALDDSGNTPLHVALAYSAYANVKWLLKARSSPDVPDNAGVTALHLASSDGAIDAVQCLLESTADISACTKDRLVRIGRMPMYECGGRTPLHVAKTVEVVQCLVSSRADANFCDCDGNTPWDVFLRDGNKPRVDLAQALHPDIVIPSNEVISALKREDYRARQHRLTLKDLEERLMEESDLPDAMGSDHCSDVETADAHLMHPPCYPKEKPWSFASPPCGSSSDCLLADAGPNTYRLVRGAHYWQVAPGFPEMVSAPFAARCVLHSKSASCAVTDTEVAPPLQPPEQAYAWNYCGHQLGKFSGQLGDGATVCARHANSNWEICWKGSGRTPFSRLGTTGRKRVSSCVREFLLSEALSSLGVPSQRGLAVFVTPSLLTDGGLLSQGPAGHIQGLAERQPLFIISKAWCSNCKATKKMLEEAGAAFGTLELEDIARKALVKDLPAYMDFLEESTGAKTVPRVYMGGMFVGGRDDLEALERTGKLKDMIKTVGALRSESVSEEIGSAGALLVRACPGAGMLRMGSFDLSNGGELDPYSGRAGPSSGNTDLIRRLVVFASGGLGAKKLLRDACRSSASLSARWAALGLVHGMLNTDNVHISGVSIDTAGFCFMGAYDSGYDGDGPVAARGRYSYRKQASAMFWNLKRLGVALSRGGQQLSEEEASQIVAKFPRLYRAAWLFEMRRKLGLPESGSVQQARADAALLDKLFATMEITFADFTWTFRCLMSPAPAQGKEMLERLASCGSPIPAPLMRAGELRNRASRLRPSESREFLTELSTKGHLKSRIAERLAQHDEADNLEKLADDMLARDLSLQQSEDIAVWDAWLAAYAERLSSCGGADFQTMAKSNPIFVPRPWLVDAAALEAENGDFSLAQKVLDLLPYAFHEGTDFGSLGRATNVEESL